VQDKARFITNWEAYGKKQIPPHYWLEYMKCTDQRIMDVTDIFHASAMRDAEAHDSSFTSFYWNTSQNASKEKHRSATPGIAGCITPGKYKVSTCHSINAVSAWFSLLCYHLTLTVKAATFSYPVKVERY